MMKRHHQVRPAPSTARGHTAPPRSSSIPVPQSHLRRTLSEIRLAEEVLGAQHEMYARLMVGMQSQCSRNRGTVNPLSWRSLQGIVKMKQASHEELAQHDGGGNDWEVSFVKDRDDGDAYLGWLTRTQPPPSKSISDVSFSSHGSTKNQGQDQDDDGCVFLSGIVKASRF